MKHIPGAEGMRGIACLIVVILHDTGPFIPAIAQYTRGTEKYGVWIFFVLSAFLLTCKILDNERSLPALGSYYISRTFRIIPPFIVAAYTYYIFGYFGFNKLILLACSDRNFVGKICNLSAFRFVGKFSFSIYLYHWLFLSLDTKVFGGNYLTFLSSITFSLILGIAAYYLIERPCNALRHYLEVNIRTRLSRSY